MEFESRETLNSMMAAWAKNMAGLLIVAIILRLSHAETSSYMDQAVDVYSDNGYLASDFPTNIIDSSFSGGLFTSGTFNYPYLRVDLSQERTIMSIYIANRVNGNNERLVGS